MSLSQDARAVAERYATAWKTDDLGGILDCYADDFTLHYFGNNPFTGDHVGKEAALNTLLEVGAKAPRKLIAVDDIMAGPNTAVIVAREEVNIDGEVFEIGRLLRYRVSGNQFTECWLYEEDQALIDRAWS